MPIAYREFNLEHEPEIIEDKNKITYVWHIRELFEEEEEPEEAVQEMRVQFEREDDNVQERSAGTPGPPATVGMRSAAAHAIHSRGPGEPLNPQTRRRLESSQGVDMSEVRVHEDSSARQAAGAMKARAFTHKNHIWLGHGQSQTNVKLMAHNPALLKHMADVTRS